MHAQNFIVDKRSDRHAIEHILKLFPDSNAVASLAFIVEPINSVDLSALVISPKQEKVFLILQFVREQQDDGLQTLLTSVHVVTQEQIVGIGREPAIFK